MKLNNRLTPIASVVIGMGMCIAAPVFAGEPIEFANGMKLDWRVNTTYTLSTRLESPDKKLAANAGGNDGDNNFDKGALTANRLGVLFDATLSKGDSGFVMSASTFYDDVYHHANDNTGPVNKAGDVDEFTHQARKYHGGYTRLLDAYGYTSFNMGSSRATVRLGKHVVSWGEGLFFPGISLAQGPADGTKTGIPGTETKDQLLPEDQASMLLEVTPTWSLMAHAQYGWHETIAPAPGSFLSTSDGVGEGGSCLGPFMSIPALQFSGCSFGKRGRDITPDETGQWGVGTRYRVTDETEVGLYYLNFHDRTPLPEINAFSPGGLSIGGGRRIGNGSYRVHFFDDVKLIGATFSTTSGPASIAGEISFKEGAPVLVNTVVSPTTGATIPNPTRADVMQANVNAMFNFGRTPLADQTLLLAELAYVEITGVKARKAPGVEALGPAAVFFPASNELSFGKRGLAFSTTLSLTYPGVFAGWDLAVPISYSQQLDGRTLTGGVGGEGDIRYSIGASLTYNRNLQIGLTYLGYSGKSEVANLTEQRLLTDRDQISLVVKYSF